MAKYHISPKTGEPAPCKAKHKCPRGSETPHFGNRADALDYVEEQAKTRGHHA